MGNSESSRLARMASNSNFLRKPITTCTSTDGQAEAVEYAVACMQGWRSHMEDAHICETGLAGLPGWMFFSVLDGHAGSAMALHSASALPQAVLFEVLPVRFSAASVKDALRRAFVRHDRLAAGDFGLLQSRSGCTCTSVLISPSHFFFANLGDSRGVLVQKGKPAFATEDHKPTNTEEANRIIRAGGIILSGRVDGGLAVSRAFGDFDYKMRSDLAPEAQKVSAQPDVYIRERDPAADEYILLACDGIWDVMTNTAAVKFVSSLLKKHTPLKLVCEKLIRRCLDLGSRDNMSAMIILLNHQAPDGKPASASVSSKASLASVPKTASPWLSEFAASIAFNAVQAGVRDAAAHKQAKRTIWGENGHHNKGASAAAGSGSGSGSAGASSSKTARQQQGTVVSLT
eukprot:m.87568 g.87568  ORF g.87568 m.87568 type:complete len:402 (-) comp15133_c0_seq1:676-1881(-)